MSVGFRVFDDILNEKLKDPKFKKIYEKGKESILY